MKTSNYFIAASIAVMALSGCGKAEEKPKETKEVQVKNEEGTASTTEMQVKETIQQLGNEALSGSGSSYSEAYMGETDGVLTIVKTMKAQSNSFQVDVSVLKDEKWTVKNKEVEMIDKIWSIKEDHARSYEVKRIGSRLLVKTSEATSNDIAETLETYQLITFDEKGEPSFKKINEFKKKESSGFVVDGSFDPYQMYLVVDGKEGPYVLFGTTTSEDKREYELKDLDGKTVKKFKDPNQLLFKGNTGNVLTKMDIASGNYLYFDEKKEYLYYPSKEQKELTMVYDTKKEDVLWDDQGKARTVSMSPVCGNLNNRDTYTDTLHDEKGMYALYSGACIGKDQHVLSFVTQNKDLTFTSPQFMEMKYDNTYYNLTIGQDKKHVYLYKIVDYKGKTTVQKNVIDKK